MGLEWVGVVTTLIGLATSVLYARRAKKAEVVAKEISNKKGDINNAELMVDLVKKANEEVSRLQQQFIKTLKFENEKFKKNVDRFEKAINASDHCEYRDNCPVRNELQEHENEPGE